MKHAKITIDVAYDETSVQDMDRLVRWLKCEVERFVGQGILTPSGEEIVDGYTVSVEEMIY